MTSSQSQTKSSSASSSLPFHGTFHTTVDGTQGVLRLEQSGANVSGKIDVALLSGRAEGNSARGELRDPQSNQVGGTFEMSRRGEQLVFNLTLRDPESGETLVVPALTFTRGEPPAVNVQLDPRAAGRWRHTWAQARDGFSVAVDTWLILNPDGTCEQGNGKAAGGDGANSFTTDRGDAERGRWRTEGGFLYVAQADKDASWERYAKYYVDGDRMMLTYDNGNKQIWERQ